MRRPFSGNVWFLLVALALIAGATLTPGGAASPGQSPWCVTCSAHWLTDVFANIALFIPLGAALQRSGLRTARTLLLAALISLAIELLQHAGAPTGRTAAVSDWAANAMGATLGALVGAHLRVLRAPSRATAIRLTITWTAALCAVMLGTSWAVSPAREPTSASAETASVARSTLLFTPGFGWYAAQVDAATVNGVAISHRGTGPVMVRVTDGDSVQGDVRVRGADARRFTVPILYVHMTDSARPVLLLAQRGDDALLRSTRRGAAIGLTTPAVALPRVFTGRDSIQSLSALVTRHTLTLSTSQRPATASLRLTPALGWTMLQSIVSADASMAGIVSALWIALWFLAGGWWAACAWRLTGAVLWCVTSLSIVWIGTRWMDMPMFTTAHLAIAAGCAVLGSLFASRRVHDAAAMPSTPM